MKKYLLFGIFLLLVQLVICQNGSDSPTIAIPESHGFSSKRLNVLTEGVARILKERKTSGAVVAVIKDGVLIYENTFGYQDMVKKIPMSKNSIFRIYSMTKPITSAATMILWEKGYFKLNDPVHLYLPEFKDMKVALENRSGTEIIDNVAMHHPITIQDLLRHTSGLTYGFFGKQTAIRKTWNAAQISARNMSGAEFITNISSLPLIGQPGQRWEYSFSTDVLGRLIEVVTNQKLGDFFKENIFDPLNMTDTNFFVPREKLNRAAQGFDYKTSNYPTNLFDVSKKPKMDSGGGGLCSTISDYAIFSQMLLNKGKYRGVRILGTKTVELMTANHVAPDVNKGDLYLPGDGYGFGLGFAVRLETGLSAFAGSKGDYRWGGLAGTGFWIDPEENLICLFMIQDIGSSGYLRDRFKALVYQAIGQ